MPRVLTDALIDEAVELHRSGQSFQKIGTRLGVHPDTLSRAIKDRGIELSPNRHNADRVVPADAQILSRYREGESIYSLAKSAGLSRGTITRWVKEAGLPIRSRSEAGKARSSRMTADERMAQVAIAHEAVRGTTQTRDAKLARARTVRNLTASGKRSRSHLELQLGLWLTQRGVDFVPEQVADVYNVDFGIGGTVAVELLGGSWHAQPARREHHRQRAHEILNAGWHMIFVWSTHFAPVNPWAADKIVTLLEEASRLPATPGK
ncbi:MAG: helix-turn-helix domain-containing protein, partial [Actinomycetaceae bacterium]